MPQRRWVADGSAVRYPHSKPPPIVHMATAHAQPPSWCHKRPLVSVGWTDMKTAPVAANPATPITAPTLSDQRKRGVNCARRSSSGVRCQMVIASPSNPAMAKVNKNAARPGARPSRNGGNKS